MDGARLRVVVERTGGFTGLSTDYRLDAAMLPPQHRIELRRLVEASGIPSGRPSLVPRRAPHGRDLVEWSVTVELPDGVQRVTATEDAMGPELVALVEFVRARSASR